MADGFKKNEDEIGALWVKSGAKGDYMTGTIEVGGELHRIVCFAVTKSSDKSPSWRVLKSKPREQAAPVSAPSSDDFRF